MEFSIKAVALEKLKSDCLVVGIYADKKLGAMASSLDAVSKGALTQAIKNGDQTGKRATTLMLQNIPGIQAERVLLVGLGVQEELNDKHYAEVVRAALKAVNGTAAADAVFTLIEADVARRNLMEKVRTAVVLARESAYRCDQLKSKKEEPTKLVRIVFASDKLANKDKASSKDIEAGIEEGVALANGIDLAKTLGNLPPNICTPTYLADTAKKMAQEFVAGHGKNSGKLKVEILDRKQMEALKMGSFLSVAKGSIEPPKLIVLKYNGGAAKDAPVVLVGKGITFDSGGISLKPGEAMDEMKYDMCGAASVLGTLRAVAEMKLKLNVIGVIPTCENMPAGNAVKPGDIVTSMSGQTIEVLNTDAEGRLILCDALTYVERFKPAAVIDIATLTGACIIALGYVNSGLFSPHDELADEVLAAAKLANDPAWRLPLDDEYQEQLKSNFADMANIGGRPAGSVTAACFLSRYTKSYKWAHLDIAGTAWKSGAAKGSTGRPVPLLTAFLQGRVK